MPAAAAGNCSCGDATEARHVVFLRVSHNVASTGKFTNIIGKTKRQSKIL
jgi:hypothetical protein